MARGTWGSGPTDIHPLKVRISFRLTTSLAMTGFTLRDSSLTPSNPQACADDVGDWVLNNFRPVLGVTDQLVGVDVVDLTTGEAGGYTFNNVAGTSPNSGEPGLPDYVCCVIQMKSELRRRYGQGRMFWPLRHEGNTQGNIIQPGTAGTYQGIIDSFTARYLGGGSSSDYTLINAHGPLDERQGTPSRPPRPAIPASWYDVQTVRLNTIPTFLRSRKVGVGS